jgi:hypothetical protein
MTESTDSAARSVISDFDETSIFEDVSSTKAGKSNEIIEKTTVSAKALYVTEKATIGKNVLTLADVSKPGFSGLSPANIKQINRGITRKIPQSEKQEVINERNRLVQKQFKGGLSDRENNRLKYVRWQLDRIDDAETGEFLDYLQIITGGHEKFAKELQGLLGQIQNIQNRGQQFKKGKKGKR